MCDELQEQLPFELLRALERIEQGSKPTAASRAIVADMTALEVPLAEETKRLFTLLQGVVVADDIADIYDAIAGPAAPRLREQMTYVDVFRALETLNSDPSGTSRPLLLIEHIAARARLELAIELRRRIEQHNDEVDVVHRLQMGTACQRARTEHLKDAWLTLEGTLEDVAPLTRHLHLLDVRIDRLLEAG